LAITWPPSSGGRFAGCDFVGLGFLLLNPDARGGLLCGLFID
jgi:hypothetical protein